MNLTDYSLNNATYSPYQYGMNTNISGTSNVSGTDTSVSQDESVKNTGKTGKPKECQTCKNRKYKDGSNEMVSFKSAAHISPTAAAGRVRAHEGEHVSNAYAKAATDGGKVLQASVSIKTSVCPECGRVYVSGGETHTKIMYSNEEQPYQKQLKAIQEDALKGNNIDVKG